MRKYQSLYQNNLHYYVLYGLTYELILNLYGPFATKFLTRIGGTDFHISLLNSVPGFVMLLVLIPGILLLRNLKIKKTTGIMIAISRGFLLLYASVPFLPPLIQPMAFIAITALISVPNTIYSSSFQGLIGDLFEPEERARAIATKSKYGVFIVISVTLLTGQLLTLLPQTEDQRILLYQVFFVVAFLFTGLELHFFKRLTVIHQTINASGEFKVVIKEIFSNRRFLGFLICSLIFHFGWQMGWPLFSIYTIKNLGANENWLAIISISSLITMFFGYTQWPRLISKYGNATITAICAVGMSFTPLLYIISKDLYMLTAMAAITGIVTSGMLTVLVSSILEVVPRENKMLYMGVYTTFTNMTLTIAPIIGHTFLESRNIQFALAMTTFFRLLGAGTFVIRGIYLAKKRRIC